MKTKRILKKIWKCKKCNARYKILDCEVKIMEKPKVCDFCGSKDFE